MSVTRGNTILIREKENQRVFISDDIARFELASISAEEYPMVSEPEGVAMVEVDGKGLSEMINKTIYCVAVEDAGFKLSGVFMEPREDDGKGKLRMVATDGHRLSLIEKDILNMEGMDLGKGVMVPKKGMTELNRLCSEGGRIELGIRGKEVVAKRENSLLLIRLLESKFPDYQSVLPKERKITLKVDRMGLLEAMRKMMILSNERYRAVRMALEANTMELVSTNPDIGEGRENLAIDYQGQRLEAGFNPRYFIECLQAMESEEVTLDFVDQLKPCVIRGELDKGFVGLVMPMRI